MRTIHIFYTLAWRDLGQHRLRTTLSALAVALGVSMVVAADVIGRAFREAVSGADDVQTILVGLLDQLDRMLVIVGVMVIAAAGFLIFNAFAMSVTQRRRQIGGLRALGMTRRQALRLVLAQALIVGGLGTLLGLAGGPALGSGVVTLLRSAGTAFNVFGRSDPSPGSLLLAAAMGVGATLLSVLVPAWRATRISPLAALRRATEPRATPAGFGGRARRWTGARLGLLLLVPLSAWLALAPPGRWVMPPWDVRLTAGCTLVWLSGLALLTPALIGAAARRGQRPLGRWWGATGRLMADNLRRQRRRVTLTVATLAVGLAMVVSMTGFMNFWLDGLFMPTVGGVADSGGWAIYSFDFMEGLAAYADLDTLQLSTPSVAAVRRATADHAEVMEVHFVVVPELSFLGSNYFSMVLDPQLLHKSGDALFTFSQGDWESAMPILEAGCGLLTTPLVARNNGAGLGDTITVQGAEGPVTCTFAGLGPPLVYASIISGAAGEAFGVEKPFGLYVFPRTPADRARLDETMAALSGRYADLWPHKLTTLVEFQTGNIEIIKSLLSGLLLLTILAAALGVVNTTLMSVAERRRELGLLRAVGATRGQVRAVVAGEAALMGLVGGGLGTVAGVGFTVILAVVYGGNAVGVDDLPLWPTAWLAARPALWNGLLGMVAAPFICAAVARVPLRSLLRGPIVRAVE